MPKYQIILKSETWMPSDEFMEHAERLYNGNDSFIVIEARNLEGIREEVWKKKTDISDLL